MPDSTPDSTPDPTVIRPAALPAAGQSFTLAPDGAALTALRDRLELSDLRKVRLAGRIEPDGSGDWRLTARLGATVVQPCVVTLDPVTTRIDTDLARSYRSDLPIPGPGEIEMPQDDTVEPLPDRIDLAALLAEELALALPDFPRAPGADLGAAQFTEPGKAPLTDADLRPFAGLADLKAALEKDDEETGGGG